MTIFRYILQFLLLKSDKRGVWDSKRPLRMKWQLSDFGEKRGFPNFPQNHCPCPHLKLWGFLGNLSLKIPKSLVLPIPEFSPKNLKTLSLSPPCPQISGTGKGISGEWGHDWPHYYIPKYHKSSNNWNINSPWQKTFWRIYGKQQQDWNILMSLQRIWFLKHCLVKVLPWGTRHRHHVHEIIVEMRLSS